MIYNCEKIAIFDFCETLANFQTGDAFVYYVHTHTNRFVSKVRMFAYKVIKRSKLLYVIANQFPKESVNKRLVLWTIKGIPMSEMETYARNYYYDVVKPNLIPVMISELIRLKNEGYRILIVSAGYEIYLKYFVKDFNLSICDLISVKIGTNKNVCSGTFDGGDRLWDKTEKLDERFDKTTIKSIAYSDSISDLPLLKWADKGVVVRRADKPIWDKDNKFNEIVWKK